MIFYYYLNLEKEEKKVKMRQREGRYIRGTSGIMYRTREKEPSLAIDDNGFSVIGYTRVNQWGEQCRESKEKEKFGNWVSFHNFLRSVGRGKCRKREREGKGGFVYGYPMSENENGEGVVFMVTTQYTLQLHSLFFVLT